MRRLPRLVDHSIHIHVPTGVYDGQVRRIQIHLDEDLDEAAEREASRRGISKAALIRASLVRELGEVKPPSPDPWLEMTGWVDDGPVEDLDAAIYEADR